MTLCLKDLDIICVTNDAIADEVIHLADNSVLLSEAYLIDEKFEYVQERSTFHGKVFYLLTNSDGDICLAQKNDDVDIFEGYS